MYRIFQPSSVHPASSGHPQLQGTHSGKASCRRSNTKPKMMPWSFERELNKSKELREVTVESIPYQYIRYLYIYIHLLIILIYIVIYIDIYIYMHMHIAYCGCTYQIYIHTLYIAIHCTYNVHVSSMSIPHRWTWGLWWIFANMFTMMTAKTVAEPATTLAAKPWQNSNIFNGKAWSRSALD